MYCFRHILKWTLNGMRLNLFHFVNFFLLPSLFPLITLSAQISPFPLKPKSQEYFFEEVKFSGGAPIREVVSLVEDSRGFIWLASKHGLIRYDGHDFKTFRHEPGNDKTLVDTELWSLFILGDTLLCVGATNGISLMDIRTEKLVNLYADTGGNPVGYVSGFYRDKEGTVWMGGLMGLYSFAPDLSGIINHNLDTPPIKKGNPAFAKRVYGITENSTDGNLLMLATECGLMSYDKRYGVIHKIYPNTGATFWRSQPPVYKFVKEGDYLWSMSWISGMPRFNMATETWENFAYPDEKTNTNIWAMSDFLVRNEKEIWICDLDLGIHVFNKETKQRLLPDEPQPCPVMKKPLLRAFMQKDGTLWLAGEDGLWVQNRKKAQFRELDVPYRYTWIIPAFHDKASHDYYFGLVHKTNGVALWNYATNRWRFLQTATNKSEELNTYSICKDSGGVVWIGTQKRGLWYVDKNNHVLKPFLLPDDSPLQLTDKTIYKIFEDSRHNLWLGTGRDGIISIDPERAQATQYSHNPEDSASLIDGTHFRAIEEDKHGRIWIGNYYGFCVFDPQTRIFSRDIPRKLYETGIKPGWTYSIVKDTTGGMWMTVTGQGLVKISEPEKDKFRFRIYQTDDGLKDLTVKYMTKDAQGNLWIANNGILCFNPYDESFMHTDTRNGLIDNVGGDAQITVDGFGNVFCGNQIGADWLSEAKKQSISKISNLIIESILVNGVPVDWCYANEKKINLSASKNQDNITFKYTSICFEDYGQVRYRYMLEGLENEWNPPTGILEARYTNLKPGRYRFVVDVAYKGNWLGFNRIVNFEIRQAFWKTWWFVALMLSLVFVVIYTIYSYRKRQRLKQRQIRVKIASDLHDDLGSTLSSISIMSDLLQSQPGNGPNAEEMIRKIGKNARDMLESMDDIIWAVNPQNDDSRNLVARIREYAIPLFEPRDIRFTIEMPESILALRIPMEIRRNLFLIAKEAVNNAVKYSCCTEASVSFSYSHSILKMIVSDNGKGFDTSKDHGRNGLRNMKYRAGKIGGKVIVRSAVGKGTTVTLAVKIGKQASKTIYSYD